jgi:hypothetical protein
MPVMHNWFVVSCTDRATSLLCAHAPYVVPPGKLISYEGGMGSHVGEEADIDFLGSNSV